jgi:archaemetzincin
MVAHLLPKIVLGLALALPGCHSGQKAPTGERALSAPPQREIAAAPPAPWATEENRAGGSPAATLGTIYLQELGERLPSDDLELIRQSLAHFFPNPVTVLPARELPKAAYYPPRQRYRAEKLLDALVEQTPEDAQVVVGLTTTDISTTKGEYEDWGILGLATVSGRECVISRFRAARGAKNGEHTRQRLAKTVVHEIGHTLGLPHCPEHGCLMEDGKGSVLTTDHELDFCAACRRLVGSKVLTAAGPLPWDPPAHLP